MKSVLFLVVTVQISSAVYVSAQTKLHPRVFRRQIQSCVDSVEFQCVAGGCISRYEVCDGESNCQDGSDETAAACRQVSISTCPPTSFQCAYGACISKAMNCDGKRDCRDGSDEVNCNRGSPSQPATALPQAVSSACNSVSKNVKYSQCDNGQCIDKYSVCDGVIDCLDKSDETEAVCYKLFRGKCPTEQWRCSYGACLHRSVHCDGRQDCWDGSDESGCPGSTITAITPSVSVTPGRPLPATASGKTCLVPKRADNRRFSVFQCKFASCGLSPGQSVANQALIIASCEAGHQLGQYQSQFITSCNEGRWFPEIPKCDKLCPKLESETLDLLCWVGPSQGCDKPMVPQTRVEFKCKPFYQSNSHTNFQVTCLPSGEWSGQLPTCSNKCGQSSLGVMSTPAIINGTVSKAGMFPWVAALFQRSKDTGEWLAACGGTLITTHVVLTAAHCVTTKTGIEPPPLSASDLMIVLGKYYRVFDGDEGTAVKVGVKKVIVHPNYRGESTRFGQDIAVLVLERNVPVNSYVMPACVDFNLQHMKRLFEDKSLRGYVAGWGNTEDCSSSGDVCESTSPVLLYTRLNVITNRDCYLITQQKRPALQSSLPEDKFCAGDGNVSLVQQGDSGGGLTFVFDGTHYVYGIVSVKLQVGISGERLFSFSAFTNLVNHMQWLRDLLATTQSQ